MRFGRMLLLRYNAVASEAQAWKTHLVPEVSLSRW
jgi:hypothetical protein